MGFRQIVFGVLMWGVFFYALRRGGWAERLIASSSIVASYATLIVNLGDTNTYEHVEFDVLVVDLAWFGILFFTMLKSHKYWPIWVTAMHGMTLLAHFAPLAHNIQPWVYFRASALWSYPMLVAIAIGVYNHRKQETSPAVIADR